MEFLMTTSDADDANTVTTGPSPFVRETAARIMAAGTWNSDHSLEEDAAFSVKAAKALEAALKAARK
jgi:hypothetical protein